MCDIDVCYGRTVLALRLLSDARTVSDQQVHHGVGVYEDSRCHCHAAATATTQHQRAVRRALVAAAAAAWGIVGTHVTLQLREGLAVNAT